MRIWQIVFVSLIGMGACVGVRVAWAQSANAGSAQAVTPEPGAPDAHGVYTVGGDVRAPVATYTPDPEFSGAASKTKRPESGSIEIGMVVDVNGIPQQVHVIHGLRSEVDAAALETVRQYRFKPAMKGSTPVPVYMNVTVSLDFF